MNYLCIRIPHPVSINSGVYVIPPKNAGKYIVTHLWPAFIYIYLTSTAYPHVRSLYANLLTLTTQYSDHIDVFLSCLTNVNTYINVAVYKAFYYTLYLPFNETLAFLVDLSLTTLVNNPTSNRQSLCRMAFTVYSNYRFNFQALMFTVFSSLVFFTILSYAKLFTGGHFVSIFRIAHMLIQ